MNELVERVAKAIDSAIERAGGWDDGFCDSATIARIAIEAMREPTDNMCGAANGIHFPDNVWRAMIQEALDA